MRKKMTQILPDFEGGKKNSKSPESFDNFQYVAKNIDSVFFSIFSYLLCNHVLAKLFWLNYFLGDRHF